MKSWAISLILTALALVPVVTSAAVIAGKLTKFDTGTSSMILLANENSKNCDKKFPGTKFAALKLANSRTAQVLYQYPGCYKLDDNGRINIGRVLRG